LHPRLYLRKTLTLPGETLTVEVTDPKIVTFANEVPGLQAVADGKIDAFLCSQPVGAGAIADGKPLRQLDKVALLHPEDRLRRPRPDARAGPVPRSGRRGDPRSPQPGKLKALSIQFFKTDYATRRPRSTSRRSTRRFRRARRGSPTGSWPPVSPPLAEKPAIAARRLLRAAFGVTILAVGGVVYVRATDDVTRGLYDRLDAVPRTRRTR